MMMEYVLAKIDALSIRNVYVCEFVSIEYVNLSFVFVEKSQEISSRIAVIQN